MKGLCPSRSALLARMASHFGEVRDAGCPAPPSRIPACSFPAPGSSEQLTSCTRLPVMLAQQVRRKALSKLPYQLARLDYLPAPLYDFGSRHLIPFQQPFERPPRVTALLAAPIEPLIQQLNRQKVVLVEALAVANDPVIIPVPAQLRFERSHQVRQLPMAMGL